MTVGVVIEDPSTGQRAEVSKYNHLSVEFHQRDVPPVGTINRIRFYSALVGSTGADSGTTNMNVDGTTDQEFYIRSHADYDIYITKILIYIVDNSVTHKAFGNISILTTGVDLINLDEGENVYLIKEAKNFADLIQQTLASAPFGDAGTSFELTDVNASNNDAQVLPFDIISIMPDGIRIGRGSQNKIQVWVRDDLTDLTTFTVRVLGYRHYP